MVPAFSGIGALVIMIGLCGFLPAECLPAADQSDGKTLNVKTDTQQDSTGSISGIVTSKDYPDGLEGVNIVLYQDSTALNIGTSSLNNGKFLIESIPPGIYQLHLAFIGYKTQIIDVIVEAGSAITVNAVLSAEALTQPTVEVTASVTKHEVSVSSTPVRIEVMVPEEVQDKITFTNTLDGALRYSGGVFVNPSRQVRESENVRLRGLDGRYLLLLRDQTMLLGYEPEDAGIWTIPLAGVRRIEIIKGNYSALYGFGGAGVINAVMRTPFNDSHTFYGITRGNPETGYDASFYLGRKVGNVGLSTVVTSKLFTDPDAGNAGRYLALPRIDYQKGATRAFISGVLLNSSDDDNRTQHQRMGVNSRFERQLTPSIQLVLKSQYADQNRKVASDTTSLKSNSRIGYGSVEVLDNRGSFNGLIGVDGYREDWKKLDDSAGIFTDLTRLSAFLQTEWTISEQWSLLYSGRFSQNRIRSTGPTGFTDSLGAFQMNMDDYSAVGTNQLLAISYKPQYSLSFRLSGGFSSVLPSSHYLLQTNDDFLILVPSKRYQMENIINSSFDIKFLRKLGPFFWTGTVSFFVTKLENHLDIYSSSSGESLSNAELKTGPDYVLKGVEVFSRFDFGDDMSLLYGYSYILPNDAYESLPGTMLPLPHHQANFEIDWEIESTGLRLEIESKLVGAQETPNNIFRNTTPVFSIWGATLEYTIRQVKVFVGAENITDFRQQDNGPLWGPREDREVYAGLKVEL